MAILKKVADNVAMMNEKDFRKLIGERVRYYRNHKNLTQEQLAEMMDFNTKSISLLENGHNYIALNKVPKLCQALEIEPYQLFIFDKRNAKSENIIKDIHEILNTMDNKKLKLAYNLVYTLGQFSL